MKTENTVLCLYRTTVVCCLYHYLSLAFEFTLAERRWNGETVWMSELRGLELDKVWRRMVRRIHSAYHTPVDEKGRRPMLLKL